MEHRSKKNIRSNRAQISYLCQYMAQHPDFAAGDYRTPLGASSNNAEWHKLKEALDELGPQRSVDQWKICLRDQKRKARDEGGALNKAKNKTGNSVSMPELSDNSVLVLSAIGQEMAVGFGPEESPIGFTQEITAPVSCQFEPTQSTSGMETENCPRPHLSRASVQRPAQVRRARKVLPPERFLNAQSELNNLIKDLLKEVKRGNDLKEQQLNHM